MTDGAATPVRVRPWRRPSSAARVNLRRRTSPSSCSTSSSSRAGSPSTPSSTCSSTRRTSSRAAPTCGTATGPWAGCRTRRPATCSRWARRSSSASCSGVPDVGLAAAVVRGGHARSPTRGRDGSPRAGRASAPPGAVLAGPDLHARRRGSLTTVGGLSGETLPAAVLPVDRAAAGALPARPAPRLGGLRAVGGDRPADGWAERHPGGGLPRAAGAAPRPRVGTVAAPARSPTWRRGARSSAVASLWWVVPLLLLGSYAPAVPRLHRVGATTPRAPPAGSRRCAAPATGWRSSPGAARSAGRAATSWRPRGWLLLPTVLVAAVGLAGLLQRGLWQRRVLVVALLVGLAVLTAGSGGWAGSVLSDAWLHALDTSLAPLRNIHKFDPARAAAAEPGRRRLRRPRAVPRAWWPDERSRRRPGPTASRPGVVGVLVRRRRRPGGLARLAAHRRRLRRRPDSVARRGRLPRRPAGPTRDARAPGRRLRRADLGPHHRRADPGARPAAVDGARAGHRRTRRDPAAPRLGRAGSRRAAARRTRLAEALRGAGHHPRRRPQRPRPRRDRRTGRRPRAARRSANVPGAARGRLLRHARPTADAAIEVYELDHDQRPAGRRAGLGATASVVAGRPRSSPTCVPPGWSATGEAVVLGRRTDEQPDVVTDSLRRVERSFGRVHDARSGVMTAADAYRVDRPGARLHRRRHAGGADGGRRTTVPPTIVASSSGGYADVLGAGAARAAPLRRRSTSRSTPPGAQRPLSPSRGAVDRGRGSTSPTRVGEVSLVVRHLHRRAGDVGAGLDRRPVRRGRGGAGRHRCPTSSVDDDAATTAAGHRARRGPKAGQVRLSDVRIAGHDIDRSLVAPRDGCPPTRPCSSPARRRGAPAWSGAEDVRATLRARLAAGDLRDPRLRPHHHGGGRAGEWRLRGRAVATHGPALDRLVRPARPTTRCASSPPRPTAATRRSPRPGPWTGGRRRGGPRLPATRPRPCS